MRLGGPIPQNSDDPHAWAEQAIALGYSAVVFPLDHQADEASVAAYAQEAAHADLLIAEVGAWSNPISPDDETRLQAIAYCQAQLALADRIGARCCVNIAGARGELWYGPYADNLTEDTFALIVDTVREIIDAVRPTQTVYALETMQWVPPDSVESYARLIEAIDRPTFGVHMDPVNLIKSPALYFRNRDLLIECFRVLGPKIVSCHAKDMLLADQLGVHLSEVRPGLGALDYATFLREVEALGSNTPLIIEHLSSQEEYRLAAEHIRSVAGQIGVHIREAGEGKAEPS